MIIASLPRSGSTYMLRCIYNLKQGNTTPYKYKDIKMHYPNNDPGGKAIFTFRSIEKVIPSMIKNRFDQESFAKCGYFGQEKNLLHEDFLNFEMMFDYWTTRDNTLCIRYESIPKHKNEIEQFAGRNINWIPFEVSTTKAIRLTNEVFKNLKIKIDKFDDYAKV